MLLGGSTSNYHKQQTNSSMDNDPLDDYLSHDQTKSSSRLIQEVASSTIIDSLANEWWSINFSPIVINDLLENLIPLVVLACEKVLNEADERQLIEINTPNRSFNPINRLASFLMRNNPKYMHYSSLSPYHYAMKTLLNTKKTQVLKVYGEEETLLRTMLKQRQAERTQQRDLISQEDQRRKNLLKTLFQDWNVPERGWIQTKLINNMLEQYHELAKQSDIKFEITPFQSHRMHLGTFTENFLNALNKQSSEQFDIIVNIYRQCAQTYTNIVQDNQLNLLFQRLFDQLDDKQSGYLFRQNVLKILQDFYHSLNDNDKQNVNQPNQWPVIKQTNFIDQTTGDIEKNSLETNNESSVTNEQQTVSTNEQMNEPETSPYIELKPTSAYEPNYRFTKEQRPIYNLEHFNTNIQSIPYDEQLINKIQFSSLLNSFSGVKKNDMIISALIDYFRSNFKETNEQKIEKKNLLQQRSIDIQHRNQSDLVFDKLNISCTGIIKLEPLTNYLKQYKDGSVVEQIEQVLQVYQDQSTLTNTQFFDLIIQIHQTINETLGGKEKFEDILKYIDNFQATVSTTDRQRIQTRQQWLKYLKNFSYRTLGELYKEVFHIIQKDSDTFGNQSEKHLSIYIGLIENDHKQIRYVATTDDQTDLLLGKILQRDQGISFQILESGKWTYINQTKHHSRLYFFDPNMRKQSGSFVLLPLKRLQRKTSNGLLGIDTIRDKKEKAFVQHEIQFYEGIATTLADKLTFVDFDNLMMKIFQRFLFWIDKQSLKFNEIDYYTYESIVLNNPKERLLKHTMKYSNRNLKQYQIPIIIDSREQIFKYSLEQAAMTCQSTIASFLGQTHLIHALRARDNYCFALIDTNIGEQEDLSSEEKDDLIFLYRCLSMSVDELEQELIDDTKKEYLTYEKQSNKQRFNYLFDRIQYMNICQQIKDYSSEKFQEFLSNKSKWNEQTKQLCNTISRILKNRELNPSDYANVLIPSLIEFDPTSNENKQNEVWTRVEQLINNSFSSSQQISGDLIKLFYNWLILAFELHQLSSE